LLEENFFSLSLLFVLFCFVFYFHNLLEAGTYGLINMAISEKKILEIWRGWCFFFHKNPLYELHWLFFLVATSPRKKRKENNK
jgi:hypothetical protein